MRRLLLLLPLALFAFDYEPWFPELLEVNFIPSYQYRHYPSINGARPKNHSSTDHVVNLGLAMTFAPDWHAQVETEFADTSKRDWGFRDAAAQIRHIVLDDTGGDPISLAIGGITRWTKTRYLQDPSTPYAANFDLELSMAVGKEFTNTYDWLYRLWGFLGAGIGNRGSPWLRPILTFQGNLRDRNIYTFFTEGYFGFGKKRFVNTNNFNGYGPVRHQSIDIGVAYTRMMGIYGSLKIAFAYRPFAHNFPRKASTCTITYYFPFSPF